MEAIATKHSLPPEIVYYIYQFDNMKPHYDKVVNELILKYNMGLWWLQVPPTNTIDKRELALETPWDMQSNTIISLDGLLVNSTEKNGFTTYNDDNIICITAILKAELLNELFQVYYNPYGGRRFDHMLRNIKSLEIFQQHKYNYMTWQFYLFDSNVERRFYFNNVILSFYDKHEKIIRKFNAYIL